MSALVVVSGVDISHNAPSTVVNLLRNPDESGFDNTVFIQDEAYTEAGVAVTPYGLVIYDGTSRDLPENTELMAPSFISNGKKFTCSTVLFKLVGTTLVLGSNIKAGSIFNYTEEE